MKKILYFTGTFCLIFFIVFLCFYYKKNNIGNNINRKNEDKTVNYILNLQNYEANIDVTVYSNKNENKYKIKQYCDINKSYQEIEEPEELKKTYMNLENNKLIIGSNKLNLKKIYEKYNNNLNNSLFLNVFIEEYKTNNNKIYENDNDYIIEVNLETNFNTYAKTKKLYINKETKKPERLEIYDNSQKQKVCIIYNYIDIK